MSGSDTLGRIIGLIKRVGGEVTGSVDGDTLFLKDLGMDSLTQIELISAVEAEFNLTVPDDEIVGFERVGDVLEFLERHGV